MIRAAKNPIGGWLVWQIIRSSIVKRFHAVHVRESEPQTSDLRQLPTIYYANHSNWWDGFMCMTLVQYVFHQDSYLIMEERNLKRYRFFTWVGVFSVDRDDARSAITSLNYAAEILNGAPGRGLYIYPQGTMVPNERRPLDFFSGIAHLASKINGDVRLVPIAIRYQFLQEQRPEVFIHVGKARIISPDQRIKAHQLTEELRLTLTADIDQLTADVIAEHTSDFRTIMAGQGGVDRTLDRLLLRGNRQSRRLSAGN